MSGCFYTTSRHVFYIPQSLSVIRNPLYMLRMSLRFRENKTFKLSTKTNKWILHCSLVLNKIQQGSPEGLPLQLQAYSQELGWLGRGKAHALPATTGRILFFLWGSKIGSQNALCKFPIFFWGSLFPTWIKKDNISSLCSLQISFSSSIHWGLNPLPSGRISVSGRNVHWGYSRNSCHLPSHLLIYLRNDYSQFM